jgi:BirA family biotin operon repressor/biotin-[acetyl-CoA-carboxylase] ligase
MMREPVDGQIVADLAGPHWTHIDVVEATGSTNADLLSRVATGADIDGVVLAAEFQNAGRGRHGRQWSAPPRSQLSFSAGIGVADVPAQSWGWLPLAAGVAVVDALAEAAGVSAGLKWPNDVLAGVAEAPGKLAGILAEVASPKPAVVLGIGLNVTLTADEAPDPKATSLAMLGAGMLDRTVLLAAVLRRLGDRIDAWRTAGGVDQDLARDYRLRSRTLGTRVRASLPGDRNLTGIAEGIDELGRLRIDTGAEIVTVSAGDITHLRPVGS